MRSNTITRGFALLAFLLVALLAYSLRQKAAATIQRDSDEAIYLAAAEEFASLIQTGNWAGFLETNPTPEHPPLTKIIFGVAIQSQPATPANAHIDETVFLPRGQAARRTSAVFGALTAGLLALVNPVGGLLLAMHTMTIKYTSEIMLEAVAAFTSLAAVLCYVRYKKQPKSIWWIASAVFLGLTAANKYMYAIVGFAILADWVLSNFQTGGRWGAFFKRSALWGIISLLAFFVFNPFLWQDPIQRLGDSLLFHSNYSQNAPEVVNLDFPFYQPFIWLNTSAKDWHPENTFIYSLDNFILIMGVLGLVRLWRKERVFVLWLIVGIVFLLLWNTKWPQYTIMVSAPIALSAGEATTVILQSIWKDFRKQ